MNREWLFADSPYHLPASVKMPLLLAELNEMTGRHLERCVPYRRILEAFPQSYQAATSLEELPMLPVQLFKMQDMVSVPEQEVFKVLTSSGTSGQQPSRIYLDRETAVMQTKTLAKIVSTYLGKTRLPMIIVDTPNVIQNRSSFSARGAGILGFSSFGRDHFYLLDEQMQVNWRGLDAFLDRHGGEKIFLFGFTFMVWRYFYQACVDSGRRLDLGQSLLIHGGGWKKLQEEQVDNRTFRRELRDVLGIREVYNYYGMVEQVGSIYMECEESYLHAPNTADVLIRDPQTLETLPFGEKGLIQTLSVLSQSYPGHSLLTEDLGVVIGEDDCKCGRHGKYFLVEGRLPAAELRGCSDTVAAQAMQRRG